MKHYDGMADEALALLYVGGDNRAFDELLARNQQKLYNYILFVVRDPELANDVFQETFVKVITRLQEGKYTDSGKFSFWLSRIAHNVIMDTYRQQKSEHIVEASEDNDLNKLRRQDLMEMNRENEFVNHARCTPSDGHTACTTTRSRLYALLSGLVVQGDCRGYGCEHQHIIGTHALRPDQHAPSGQRA